MRNVTLLTLVVAFLLPSGVVPAQEREFPEVAKPCVTCHGRDGRGSTPGYPNICGQKSIYLMQQLTMFRDKRRQSEVMSITAENLSDDDIRTIAEYYESLPACK